MVVPLHSPFKQRSLVQALLSEQVFASSFV
jgi:hypothetical protein